MKNNLTEIAFVLDRSGSMRGNLEAAIAGFNAFVRDQNDPRLRARLTLVLFDDQYEVPVSSVPLAEVCELTTETYVPRGSTALLDAIGRTIEELSERLGKLPPAERPSKVIVPILTDGLENSSRHYTWARIAELIAEKRGTQGWEFLFLGADADAIATAARMNIKASHSASYAADAPGHLSAKAAFSRKVKAMRLQEAGAVWSSREARDASMPLREIVEEEDRKRRS